MRGYEYVYSDNKARSWLDESEPAVVIRQRNREIHFPQAVRNYSPGARLRRKMDGTLSKYEETINELYDDRDGSGFRTEKILAFWSHDDFVKDSDGEIVPMWMFRPYDISPTFEQTFGENWHLRVYSYDVWKDMLDILHKVEDRQPKEIEVDIKYVWRKREKLQIAVYLQDIRVNDIDLDFLEEEFEDVEPHAK